MSIITEDLLRQLIDTGETRTVEFKGEERAQISDRDLVEAVVCLANRSEIHEPGWLIIGVEDDGRITGARPRHNGVTDPDRLAALISSRTRPSLTVKVDIVTLEGKEIIVIQIPAAKVPIGTTDGRYLRRAIDKNGRPQCLPYYYHEMQIYQADLGLLDYSAQVVPGATWDDLDPREFDRFRYFVKQNRGRSDSSLLNLPDEELAKVLGAVEINGEKIYIRVLGLLLFGTEDALRRFLPSHEIAFQILRGTKVVMNDFFRWPLLRAMEEIQARFDRFNNEQELMIGILRIGVPDYSPDAFREAVANALVHRDYRRLGAVHIQWNDDRIEISNPGGFIEGVRLDNLLVTAPKPRNPLLADALKRAGIVERTARGIDIIFREQLRNGRPAPSYDLSTESNVMLVLPGGEANLKFVQMVVEESQNRRELDLDELLILNALWQERTITTPEAAQLIQKNEETARSVLNRLVESGFVEPRGVRKGRTWHLSAATYRRLGEKAAYIRQRGFEPLQQKQMILQYVEAHGRITRSEVAELCQISPFQASRLLDKLVQEKKLRRHGKKRGTWYELIKK